MANIGGRQGPDRLDRSEETITEANAIVPAWLAGSTVAALSVSRSVYSKRAVLAAAYKLSDRAAVLVDQDGDNRWIVYVIARREGDAKALLPTLIQELGDQALRAELEQQFGDLRTLLVAQAFSEGNLLDPTRDDADPDADDRGVERRR
jgi:His-Xaa-Ser system protein HxsD